jgi:hypothetical protein
VRHGSERLLELFFDEISAMIGQSFFENQALPSHALFDNLIEL